MLDSGNALRAKAQQDVVPVGTTLSLEEALARGMKYNLSQRAQMMEQAVALNVWKAGNFDLLPRAMASAGYRHRDSYLISRSRDSVTGLPSLAHPFISSDREYTLYDLGASWSVVDFTLGYYVAKQNADRILIAAEHRRKAMHVLSRDITIAFWRLVCAQKLSGEVRSVISQAEAALADAAQARTEGLRSPGDNLRFQRQLLENIRLLASIDKELSTARITLSNLINVPLQAEFTVVEPEGTENVRILDVPVVRLEDLALAQNADLREQAYNQRIASVEVRKSLARLLPNLSLNYDLRYNTDSFLINKDWTEAGVMVSQNLTSLLAAPSQRRLAKGGVELATQRRLAVQMALLTQVHIARVELVSSYRQLKLADRIWALDQELRRTMGAREEAQSDSKLNKIAADTSAIVSLLRRYQALAEFNAANGNLQASLGMQADVGSVDSLSLSELTQSVSGNLSAWREGRLPEPAQGAPIQEK